MSLPVSLRLDGRLVLLAGGGPVAYRKAMTLHETGARLRIVAPHIASDLRTFAAGADAAIEERPYEPTDLDGVFFAIAATDDDRVNAQIVDDAARRGILSSDATEPDRGDVTMQAIARVGAVTFAIDTGGASPAFAKRIAREVQEHFGENYGRAARTLSRMRTYVKAVLEKDERGDVLRELASLPIDRLASMNPVEAEHETEAVIGRLRSEKNGQSEPSVPSSVVCASRGSALAMTQTRWVAAKLAQRGLATSILTVTTTGDRVQDRALTAIGAESLFVKELELALRDGRADYAVHSCKDLPSALPSDMRIAAISQREDPRDVFCSERYPSFDALPAGARVGTSSLRRRAQLAALRADLEYADVRGNVDTRLRKLREGQYDAIVLAAAGLRRLGVAAKHTVAFEVDRIVPATGQGALAIETRACDAEPAAQLRAAVNDERAELAVLCERAALRALQGGCQAPIGIHAHFEADVLVADGAIAAIDGSRSLREQRRARVSSIEQAEALGAELAQALFARGALAILEGSPRPKPMPLAGKLVILPRTQERPSRIAAALRSDGAEVLELRSGEAAPGALGERIPDLIVFPSSGSVHAASAYLQRIHRYPRRPVITAMGPASSAAAHAAGFTPDLVAPDAEIGALLGVVRAQLIGKEQTGS